MSSLNNRKNSETIHKLKARGVFYRLSDDTQDGRLSKPYAHHLARACWHGSRVVLRQASPEAEGIFDFIIELHRACNGRWDGFGKRGIEQGDLDTWLEFAAAFLSNLGNYFDRVHRGLRADRGLFPKALVLDLSFENLIR